MMALTPEQHSLIAAAYQSAADDHNVPPQHRKAFARKAAWFRMLASLGAKPKLVETHSKKQPEFAKHRSSASETNPPMISIARHLFAWQRRR